MTGGSGFLGRGIIRYVQQHRLPCRITAFSRSEHTHSALRARYPDIRTVLGDVRDLDRLTSIAVGHDIIIHAAAMKHIPEAERDVYECVATNVLGSQNVIRAAMHSGSVKQVVCISTDKAPEPRNTYGISKALMERQFQEAARLAPEIRFTSVRYGNVVSSTGSVVPLFLRQIEEHGEIRITSPNMTRFWVPIDSAVELIVKALSDDGRNGYTYVQRCEAMSVLDVANAVWAMAYDRGVGGVTWGLKYRTIGVRPGEKLHETLVSDYEAAYAMEDMDPRYVLVPPAHSMAGEGPRHVLPYSSDKPAAQMSPERFITLIRDAEKV